MNQPKPITLDIPAAGGFFLTEKARYKVAHGGRGSGKSWTVAGVLCIRAMREPLRILCGREFQTSIKDSVHRLLSDRIASLGMSPYFRITRDSIKGPMGAEFLFKGLRTNIQEIKSTEAIDIAWIEEAQTTSDDSWQYLIPTVRKPGSEIWVTYNPDAESDATHQRFVVNPPFSEHSADPDERAIIRQMNWSDNPWFPKVLDAERRRMKADDPDAYDWIWEGHCRKISAANIFRNRWEERLFETPQDPNLRFFYGMDFGFADDPAALIRCYIVDDVLYIDQEAFGHHIELDDLPAFMAGGVGHDGTEYEGVEGTRQWPIKGDGSRPETISYLKRQGFQIDAAEKWPGSVEDGITHLKGFSRIVIHPRCKRIAQEFRLYSFKVDRITGDVLPVIVDKWNHGIDALRYSLDGYIQGRGGLGVWARLGD